MNDPRYKWVEEWVPTDLVYPNPDAEKFFGYVPNYPRPVSSDHNPFDLIEGNENKQY